MRIIAVFKKIDGARHISHLDLQRAVQRALRRSGLPVRFSSGFNPHHILSFASALSLGFTGIREVMDVAMTKDVSEQEFFVRMGAQLPPALALVEAHAVDDSYPGLMGIVASCDYEVVMTFKDGTPKALSDMLKQAVATPLLAEKKTKAGIKTLDLREQVLKLELLEHDEQSARLFVRCDSAASGALNPRLLVDSLRPLWNAEFEAEYVRTGIWADKAGEMQLWEAVR